MTKHRYSLLLIVIITQATRVFASSAGDQAPAKSNINEVTDFFSVDVQDRSGLDTTFRDMQSAAKSGIESGSSSQEIEMEGNLKAKASELSSISAHDLESRGRNARHTECAFYDENEMDIDYASPLISQHKSDVDQILNGCDSFLSNILGGLKTLGIDCEQVAGNRVQEPEYNVYTVLQPDKDTFYKKTFCEHLKNRYSCNYTLGLKCSKWGIEWQPWQNKEIHLDGHMLYRDYVDWGFGVYWKEKRHGWHIHKNHPRRTESPLTSQQINDQARQFLANHHGVTIDNIGEVVEFPESGRGIGNITPLYSRWRVAWDYYVFKYKYRDGRPICIHWNEDWSETCKLK